MKVTIERVNLTKQILKSTPPDGHNAELLEQDHVLVIKEFEKQYVSNVLTLNVIKGWHSEDGGRFIVSQTGTGKSSLTDTIRKIALERGCRIALFGPRAALMMQYKKDFIKAYDKKLGEKYTELGLHDLVSIDVFDIYTVQALSNPGIQQHLVKNRERYGFVIIDEIHELISDADFNPFTALCFDFLINRFGVDAVRIYMTATPENVLEQVVKAENKISTCHRKKYLNYSCYWTIPQEYLTVYRFKKDFSYVNLFFFHDTSEIPNLIGNIRGEKEKSLIFVNSRNIGNKLAENFNSKFLDTARFLTADSKDGPESSYYFDMIDSSQFSHPVLISTKFLDVGISFKDSSLKNIVICSLYREEVEQMLGRKRLESPHERINLFLKLPNKAQITSALYLLREKYDSMKTDISEMPEKWSNFTELPHPCFAIKKGSRIDLGYNRFSLLNNIFRQKQLASVLGTDDQETQENYIRSVMNILPGCNLCYSFDTKTEISDYLDKLIGTDLSREAYLSHCKTIMEMLGIKRDKDQENDIPTGTVNSALKEKGLYYCIVNLSREGKKQMWRFERGN